MGRRMNSVLRSLFLLFLSFLVCAIEAGPGRTAPSPSPISSGPLAHLKTEADFTKALRSKMIPLSPTEIILVELIRNATLQHSGLKDIAQELEDYTIAFSKMDSAEGAQLLVFRFQVKRFAAASLFGLVQNWMAELKKHRDQSKTAQLKSSFEASVIPLIKNTMLSSEPIEGISHFLEFVVTMQSSTGLLRLLSTALSLARGIKISTVTKLPSVKTRESYENWISEQAVQLKSLLSTYEHLQSLTDLARKYDLKTKKLLSLEKIVNQKFETAVQVRFEKIQHAYRFLDTKVMRTSSQSSPSRIESQATVTCKPRRENNYCNSCQRNGCQPVTTNCNDSKVVTKCGPSGAACADRKQCSMYLPSKTCQQNGFTDGGSTTPIIPMPPYSSVGELHNACTAQHESSHLRDHPKTCSSAQSEAIAYLIEQNCLMTAYNTNCPDKPNDEICVYLKNRALSLLAVSSFSDCLANNLLQGNAYRYAPETCDKCRDANSVPDQYVNVYCRAHTQIQ